MSSSLRRLLSISFPSAKIPDAPLPMPRSLFYLTCTSLFFTTIALIASALDYGVLSLWVTPPTCVITYIFHITVMVLSRRPRNVENPSYFSTVIVCTYIIAVLWCTAFVTTMTVLLGYKDVFTPEVLHGHYGLPTTRDTQRLQCALAAFELATIVALGVQGHLIASKEGDPTSWRPPPIETRSNSIMPIQRAPTDY
ncbi:hypothetical protein CPB85DRAFT_1432518 [Mucidula mucida]|nr:hypothetical protein CPB85DRAFT_1432518 [Mucidula mucida]